MMTGIGSFAEESGKDRGPNEDQNNRARELPEQEHQAWRHGGGSGGDSRPIGSSRPQRWVSR